MAFLTSLSANELYCLIQKGYKPGKTIFGNSIYPLGLRKTIHSDTKNMLGIELKEITKLIKDGRELAYQRMQDQARSSILGVTNKLYFHPGIMECVTSGNLVHDETNSTFSTAATGQELFAELDMGLKPQRLVFGNVAYSTGISGGIIGKLKVVGTGEITKSSHVFNQTYRLAFDRIVQQAKENKANCVVGIGTHFHVFSGVSELFLTGNACFHPLFGNKTDVVTSHLSAQEMWSLAKLGYAPLRLLIGTTLFSLGWVSGIKTLLKSFTSKEMLELTHLMSDAKERTLAILTEEARSIQADEIMGLKIESYNLGNGIIQFVAIATAIKKTAGIKTDSLDLPWQAVISKKDGL